VLGVSWHQDAYSDPFELPPGHFWDPTAEQIIDLLVYCIFDVKNPNNGLEHITGSSDREEYNLRKCIAYDAIEFRGTYGQINEAWTNTMPLPDVIDVDEESSVVPRGSVGAASSSSHPASRQKRMASLRPTDSNRLRIDTNSGVAMAIKKSAALMLSTILGHITETRAASDGLVKFGINVVANAGHLTTPNDWLWFLFYAFVVWLIIVHAIAFYFVCSRWCCRVRARISNSDVAVQVTLLPDVSSTTVVGLRRELRFRGLRATGLRSDLERRLAADNDGALD
jgi:hypothetical protein